MRIVTLLAQFYILLFILGSLLSYKIRLKRGQYNVITFLFIVSMIIEAHNINIPPTSGDLAIHMSQLEDIKNSNLSFGDFLFKNSRGIGMTKYVQLLAFNVLRYLIVALTDDYYWLPAICVAIESIIFVYILTDWNSNNGLKNKIDTLSILIYFACMPFISAVSGIRNVLAFSIAGLSIYLYLIKGKSIIGYIVLNFISATIHPSTLLTVPFVFLARLDLKAVGVVAVFLISMGSSFIAKVFSASSIQYFQIIGRAYYTYTSAEQYRSSRFMLYGDICLLIVFLLSYFFRRFSVHKREKREQVIYNFLALYMIYILGNIGNFDMILRPTYLVGAFSPIVTTLMRGDDHASIFSSRMGFSNLIKLGLLASAFALSIYVNVKFMMTYWQWFKGR